MASLAGNSGSGCGLLVEERVVLGEIGALVDRVASTDLLSVSREELAEIVSDMAAESERLSAVAGRFMAVGEQSACSYTKGESTMIGLVNARGRLSRQRAASIRRAGRALHRYPSFHTALLARKITLAHVDVMTKWANKANSDQVRASEEALAAVAVLTTPEQFEQALRTWVAVADPNEHLEEFLRAQGRRHLILQPDLFANVHVTGVLDPLLGEQVMNTVLDNASRLRAEDDGLSIAQANHDALIRLILDHDGQGVARPHLEILVPADDPEDGTVPYHHGAATDGEPDVAEASFRYLVGRKHRAGKTPVIGDRGFANVFYPRTTSGNLIPPTVIHQLASHSRVRYHRLTADGSLAGDTPARRNFTTVQRRMIGLRDTRCQHSGCRRPARTCEYDHIQAWSARGPTLVANGQLLCRLHHRWKHRNDPTHHSPVANLFHDGPLTITRE